MAIEYATKFSALPFLYRRIRAYAAPVNRMTATPTRFDPVSDFDWIADKPVNSWIDLGWVDSFNAVSESTIAAISVGVPIAPRSQVRQTLDATVSFNFVGWSKLSMALSSGSQHLNVLASTPTPTAEIATANPARSLKPSSTASLLYIDDELGPFKLGSLVVIDDDYNKQSGFIGSGMSGSYVGSNAAFTPDANYIRRVSYNVAQISGIAEDGALELAAPLIAGTPGATMKVQGVVGFISREGGNFLQEWSALFVRAGVQGEKLFTYYPRLQSKSNAREVTSTIAPGLEMVRLSGIYQALPVLDMYDGESVLCYSSHMRKPAI